MGADEGEEEGEGEAGDLPEVSSRSSDDLDFILMKN